MHCFHISESCLHGELFVPPSKSQTLRAILFASLAHGKSIIRHPLASTDTASMIDACRHFGARIEEKENSIEIDGVKGKVKSCEDVIQAGNSGIVLRFCSAVGALGSMPVVVTGDYSIRHHRPIKPLLEGLKQLGVSVKTMRGDGYAPVIIQGPIKPGTAVIDGEDSQPVSALLIASALAEGAVEIQVRNPGEKPWVGLTLDWFDRLGIPYKNKNFERYHIPGRSRYNGFEYSVPGDFSSAAFPIAAALITQSELTLKNVDFSDAQGDKELIHTFQKMGARIEIDPSNKLLHVKKSPKLNGVTVDINNFIDAITILAVVACYAEGETIIHNAAIAKQKECNRINAIVTELSKMGAEIKETADGLIIRRSSLKGGEVYSHQDHRMAMSLAVAGLGAIGETKISSVECVSKTFPTFLKDFNAIGAQIR